MPRIIEAPDEFVSVTGTIEDNERSQRSTDLAAPEAFVPRASPVDLSRGTPRSTKLETLRGLREILDASVGAGQQGLHYFKGVQQRTQEAERDEVGLAMREAEVIEAAPAGPIRRFFQGANPFIGQGRNEQFGENTRIRAAAAFETALLNERVNRATLRAQGQEAPSIETPEEVLAWANDYFDSEMLNHELGRDPNFQRGFREDLRGDLEAILQREEVGRRERVVDEALEAGAQLGRELQASIIDDVTGSISGNALEEGLTAWIETGVAHRLGTKDELTAVVLQASNADLMDRVRRGQWEDLDASTLGTIKQQLMAVAGEDTENRRYVSDMISNVDAAVDRAQVEAGKAADAADEEQIAELEDTILTSLAEGDEAGARNAALQLGLLTDPGKANKLMADSRELLVSTGVQTANESAFNLVLEQMDLNGWTLKQVNQFAHRLETQGGFTFSPDQRKEFRLEQNRNQGRGRVRQDDSFKVARRELTDQIKLAGGAAGDDPFSGLFGGLTADQATTANAYNSILRAFDQRVISAAMEAGGIEAIRSSDQWGRILRTEADNALGRIEKVAMSASDPKGPAQRAALLERLKAEQAERDRADAQTTQQIKESSISPEEKVRAGKAVQSIQRVERIIQAFPQDQDGSAPFLDPGVALAMNGIADPLEEYSRQQALLNTQIESLQGALRSIAQGTPSDADPRSRAGSAQAVATVQSRLDELTQARDEVDAEIAALEFEQSGDVELASN